VGGICATHPALEDRMIDTGLHITQTTESGAGPGTPFPVKTRRTTIDQWVEK
jgi:hypothetical protein